MKFIKFASLIALIVAFTGCKKLQEKWIVGTWQVETLDRGDKQVYWIFNDDNTVLIVNDPILWSTVSDTVEGSWAIKSKISNYVEITGVSDTQLDGKWFIEKMNSKLILLTRRELISGEKAGAYHRRELYK